jgi:hypothetical protein
MSKPTTIMVMLTGTHDEQAEVIEAIAAMPHVVNWQTNNWKLGQRIQQRGRTAFSWLGRHAGYRVVKVP